VLVTGAGRGLGRAIANRFHDSGYHTVATDCDVGLFSDLEEKNGYTIAALDVTSDEAADAAAAMIKTDLGRLDVVVNNAGINAFYPVCEAPTDMTVNTFQINTFGPLRTIRACLDLLIASKGRIVNVSSESASLRTPFQSYASSKMALEALTDAMRRELQLMDVHIALVRPGAIQTELFDEIHDLNNAVENSRFDKFFGRFAAGVAKRVPKNPSTPAEVAEVVFEAATDEKKKVLYKINNNFALRVLGRLPAKLVDKILGGDLQA
jgi:NAD(P)-dependent dehydrogenase (short-subunit alcohol dehydrogenase family)